MRYEEFFLNFAVIMQQKDNSHKSWAQGKKPSMKRRCADNNYTERGLYLITIATEGRLLLLSPFQWQNEKITNMRQRCLYLNELAKRICEEANKKG